MQSKLYYLVCFLTLFLIIGCNLNKNDNSNKQENKNMQSKYAKTIDECWILNPKREYQFPEIYPKVEPLDRILTQWQPNVFDKHGDLFKINKLPYENISTVNAYPIGWSLGGGKIINPEDCRIIKNFESEEDFIDGPTDGEYVFGQNNSSPFLPTVCWNINSKKVVWKRTGDTFLLGDKPYHIIGNNLCVFMFVSHTIIKKVNPWTGEDVWVLSNVGEKIGIPVKTTSDKKLFIALNIKKYLNQGKSDFVIDKSKLYKINPDNGDLIGIDLPYKPVKQIAYQDNFVYVLYQNGHLSEIDADTLKEKSQKKVFDEITPIDEMLSIGHHLLFNNWRIDNYKIKAENFLNPRTGQITEIKAIDTSIINNSLIIRDKDQTRCVDPDTLETIWSINEPDCQVLWQDWRGVLVRNKEGLFVYNTK